MVNSFSKKIHLVPHLEVIRSHLGEILKDNNNDFKLTDLFTSHKVIVNSKLAGKAYSLNKFNMMI